MAISPQSNQQPPYEWEKCGINIHITLLPDDGNPAGRLVSIGVTSHQDAPILKIIRLSELELPPVVENLLRELQQAFPERSQRSKKPVIATPTQTIGKVTQPSSAGITLSKTQSNQPDQLDLFSTAGK